MGSAVEHTLLDAALDYAEEGVLVFPCRRTDKRPYTRHGFHDATTDPDQVRAWWMCWPDALIATPCTRFWALDVDGDAGEESIAKIAEGRPIHTTTVQTSRGLHYHFSGRGPKQGQDVCGHTGIDVRSNGRGYVILPPSIHNSGFVYSWAVPRDEMQEAPAWLVEALGGVEPDSPAPAAPHAETNGDRPNLLTKILHEELSSALAALPSDDYETWVNVGMALEATGGGEAALQTWIEWSRKSAKFKGEDDCRRKWRSFGKRPEEITPATVFHYAKAVGWVRPDRAPPAQGASTTSKNSAPSAIDRLWGHVPLKWATEQPPPRRYLVTHPDGDGLLPLGKAGILTSQGGTGKTNAVLQLAVAIATGRDWLDHFLIPVGSPRKVLLLLGEEDVEEVWRRIHHVCELLQLDAHARAAVAENIYAIPLSAEQTPLLRIEGDDAVPTKHLLAMRARLADSAGDDELDGWGLIVIDPLSRFAGIDAESDNRLATQFVQACETLTRSPGTPTVLVCAHSSKESIRAGRADSRGVTGLTDGFRWHATLCRERDRDWVTLAVEKNNYARPTDDLHLCRKRGGLLAVEAPEDTQKRLEEERTGKLNQLVLEVVEALRREGTVSSKEALGKLVKGRQSDCRAAIDLAVDRGLVVCTKISARQFKYSLEPIDGQE